MTLEMPQLLALGVVVTITMYTELRDGKIYNWMTLPALGLGLLLAALGGRAAFYDALAGVVVGGGIFFLPYLVSGISRGRPVIGGGDVKLAAAIGALTGLRFTLSVVYYGVLSGAVIGLAVIGWRYFSRRQQKKMLSPHPSPDTDSVQPDKQAKENVGHVDGDDGREAGDGEQPPPSVWLTRIPFGTAICVGVLITFYLEAL